MSAPLVALLLVLPLVSIIAGCPPEVCICKWKGGKQTVECGGQQLANIPEGMDPGTQVLNFSGNSLQVLQSERFLRMDLLNLQKIYLSRNQLIRIHEKAFRGLTNLVELDLSENALQHVPSETFQDYSSLMRLSLSGNPIRELKTSAFRHLSFLTTLELSNCQVERIENEAFVGMDNLEWLRLDGNRIGFIQGNHILPKSLHGISLHSNRWNCDCRLLDIHSWLVNYNTPLAEEPKCMEPARLKGQVIKGLQREQLACLPEVSPQSSYTEVSEGRNMSITCLVRAIPEPKVLWLFNGQVMSNDSLMDNLHMFYYIDESIGSSGAEEKRSEIFIYNVGAEDNGTFSCVGQNIAGTTFSNYTLRVIIKEPPVVNEVSFPRDYMNYIVASSAGGGIIFVVLLCTIVVKCKRTSEPAKQRKKCEQVTSIAGGTDSSAGSTQDTGMGMMKCASILNDGGDSMTGNSGMHLGDTMTPTKATNGAAGGGIILGGQMKQNLLLYATPNAGQQQLQLNVNLMGSGAGSPPLLLSNGHGLAAAYCSPPASLRNYQEKNPDLVNDAESVKHKLKAAVSLDGTGDYETSSDCGQYEGCYQLAAAHPHPHPHAHPHQHPHAHPLMGRFTQAMTTLPRGMQLKSVMAGTHQPAPHQVDVHLNPVCFLGQDGFAYDYSSAHLVQQSPQQQQQQQQQQLQPAGPQPAANFYRTLPHNRLHKQQQFQGAAAPNSSLRYSLEAEFIQRGPVSYEKYQMPNVRFTAEGYPQQQQQQQQQQQMQLQQQQQFPSPPEGYKSDLAMLPAPFQQWPSCLPGYRYAQSPTQAAISPTPQAQAQPPPPQPPPPAAATATASTSTGTGTIPELDESEPISPRLEEASSEAGASASGSGSAATPPDAAATEEESASGDTSKLKHLNGPLADSPDEGYVGDGQETSDI
ncbi:uncharacterized protein LOC117584365 [Drosophila guanche]|uniref:Blast:Leucine-rich repeat-containing protein 24 n=1 Tax=Drosophila guanche TaxID=7266 RepID=A0A3B0KF29_DROGU|nr:uncharacterized protein LOC117584365 [Drosophila guanche]SPP82218.1 blast:Leucine-rich repeat-containing protein 24 [Drosophila guanche]